jgi:hypothetical protein
MKATQVFDLLLFLLFIFVSISIWTYSISVASEIVPTVINGVTTSISLAVGFTVASIGIAVSNPTFQTSKTIEDKPRILLTMSLLIFAVGLLWSTYWQMLIIVDYQLAVRTSLTGLLLAISILIDFVTFIVWRLS